MAVRPGDLDKLANGFAGEIVRPADPGYDAARAVWNSMIDRRPALIVRPAGADDVVAAVRFARERELVIAVRCGGYTTEELRGALAIFDDPADLLAHYDESVLKQNFEARRAQRF